MREGEKVEDGSRGGGGKITKREAGFKLTEEETNSKGKNGAADR